MIRSANDKTMGLGDSLRATMTTRTDSVFLRAGDVRFAAIGYLVLAVDGLLAGTHFWSTGEVVWGWVMGVCLVSVLWGGIASLIEGRGRWYRSGNLIVGLLGGFGLQTMSLLLVYPLAVQATSAGVHPFPIMVGVMMLVLFCGSLALTMRSIRIGARERRHSVVRIQRVQGTGRVSRSFS